MKIEKKHIIIAGLGIISLAAAGAYYQYTKLMNYCIGPKNIKTNAVRSDNVDADLFLNFKNQSNVKFDILSQDYSVYVGDKLVTTATNRDQQTISPNSTSILKVNVKFNPIQSGKNLLTAILKMGNTPIRIDMKFKVRLWIFTVSIPYTYSTTIKELINPTTPSASIICKKQ